MKIFENHNEHQEYSTSYVLGNYCWNGCQFFHKNQAAEVFDKFDVPQEFCDEILEAFSDEPIPYLEKDKTYDYWYKAFLIKLGRKQDLDILIHDPHWVFRRDVAKCGHKEHLDILVHDENVNVREEVAKYGQKEHLDILVYDDTIFVREEVAIRGFKEHLDILVYDDHPIIRLEVATSKYPDLLDILINDEDEHVRTAAENTLKSIN